MMTGYSRFAALAAALTTAIWAGAAFAQVSEANRGTGEGARGAPDGPELARDATPIDPPRIEPGATSRSLELAPDARVKSFGAVGRTRDGEEVTVPASEALEEIIRSDAGNDDRTVFGPDDRIQITDPSAYPFRTIGVVWTQHPNGEYTYCTGTLIGPRTVLTAANCLYDHWGEGWLDNFIFAPGFDGSEQPPFGSYGYETAYINQGYLDNFDGSYSSVLPWDLAILILQEPAGEYVGWMAYGYDDNLSDFTANLVGYPGDKPYGTMWRSNCLVERQNIGERFMVQDCDTYPGTGGSAVYLYTPSTDERVIFGVDVAQSDTANTAVRINREYFEWLQSLVE